MTAGEGTPKHLRFDFITGIRMPRVVTSPRRRRITRKCLFGTPDRDETRRLIAEQHSRDRRRILLRFDYDIDRDSSPERLPAEVEKENTPVKRMRNSPDSPTTRLPCTPGSPARRFLPRTPSKRSPLTPRQLHLTEYWTKRKRTESTSSDKE